MSALRSFRGILLAALALYLVLTLAGIDRYPRVWVDEGWIAEPAWSLAHGGPLASVAHGDAYAFASRLYWMPPLQFLALAGVYALGLPPLEGGRLLSVVAGALGLVVLLLWGRRLLRDADRRGAGAFALLWLALAFTLDPFLWKVHRTIRFEAVLGFLSLAALYAAWTPERRYRALLAGLAAGLALMVHPNGAFAVAAAALLLGIRPGLPRRRIRDLVVFGAVVAALALPFALYLLGDRATGFANVIGQNAPHLRGGGESLPARWLDEWRRYAAYFAWPNLAPAAAAWALALALGLRRRVPAALYGVLAVYVLGLASLPNKSELYLTLVAPLVYLVALHEFIPPRRGTVVAAAVVWLVFLAAADVALLGRDRACRYGSWAGAIAARVPATARVAGSYIVWFPLAGHPFLEIGRRGAGDILDARPDLVIWDEQRFSEPQFGRLRRELGGVLAAAGDSVAVVASPCYGRAVLWRVRWDEVPAATAAGLERHGRDGGGAR